MFLWVCFYKVADYVGKTYIVFHLFYQMVAFHLKNGTYRVNKFQWKLRNKKRLKRESEGENGWVQGICDSEGSMLKLIVFHCITLNSGTGSCLCCKDTSISPLLPRIMSLSFQLSYFNDY